MIKRFKSDIFQDNKYLIVTILIICTIFFYLEFKIWYGEFSKSKLMVMQKEITVAMVLYEDKLDLVFR